VNNIPTLSNNKAGAEADFPRTPADDEDLVPEKKEQGTLLPHTASIGPVLLCCALFSTAVTLAWLYLPDGTFPFAKTSLIGFSIVTLLRLFGSLLLPVAFFASWYRLPDRKILGTYPGIGAFLISFVAGIPFSVVFTAIHNFLLRFFIIKDISIPAPAFFFISKDTSDMSRLLSLGVAFLIPILLQELFFRGIVFSFWPSPAAKARKILLSAVLFAVFIENPIDFIPFFLLGILLGYVRQATDNVLCPVLTQIAMLLTYRAFSSLLPYLDWMQIKNASDLDTASLYSSAAALIISLVAFLPVLAQLRRLSHEADALDQTPESKRKSFLRGQISWSLGLSFLLFAVNWVIMLGI